MVSIMGTPRLPGWDLVLGAWGNLGKTRHDIVFDSIIITNSTSTPDRISLSIRVRAYEDAIEVPDNDVAMGRMDTHPKYGKVAVYVIDVDKNSLHLVFDEGEKNLLQVAFLYEEDTTFAKENTFVLLFNRVLSGMHLDPTINLRTIEGIFVDERFNINNSPDTWVAPFAPPTMITAGYIHYFPLFAFGHLSPSCVKIDKVEVDTNGSYIVTAGPLTWTIPGSRQEIHNNGITLTEGKTNYKMDLYSAIRTSGTPLGSGSKLIGTYKSREGEELTLSANDITVNQLKMKHALAGDQKCYIGYAGANTVVMIYYPLVIVHFNAFANDVTFTPEADKFVTYLADGEEWPPLPSGGGGSGGGGGGSSGLLFGLVALIALAFMAK